MSHGFHQWLAVFRTLVTKADSARMGGGNPHRIITSSRIPSGAVRTTGAI
jgi:hypothetical protein